MRFVAIALLLLAPLQAVAGELVPKWYMGPSMTVVEGNGAGIGLTTAYKTDSRVLLVAGVHYIELDQYRLIDNSVDRVATHPGKWCPRPNPPAPPELERYGQGTVSATFSVLIEIGK